MKNILDANFMKDMIKVTNDMWLKGWDERNGGNISYRLSNEEIEQVQSELNGKRSVKLSEKISELAGEVFLISGSGKYFRNIILEPEINLGIIKICEKGESYTILWGLEDGAFPTSELSAHLMSHRARMEVTEGKNRVILHTHATNLIALTYVEDLDNRAFTKKLWQMSTECLVVFPQGVGILEWLVPGTDDIGNQTAELMKKHTLVLWPFHGVFGAGETLDEAMGLVDTAEKAAEILVKVNSMGGIKQTISDSEFVALAKRFNVEPLEGVLKV